MTPELSIIIPVYNVRQWLPACMASILSQTFTNWELLLIDDGSTDGSGELCDDYASKDKRVTVIHKANAGVSAARNDGLDRAKGRFLTFIDSDDELGSETTLEENMNILASDPEIDIVQFPWQKIKDGNILKSYPINCIKILSSIHEMLASTSTFELTYQVWQKIYRAEVLNGIRFNDEMKIGEDGWFIMDLFANVRKICLSPKGMYRYNIRGTSAMNTMTSSKKTDEFMMSYRLFMMFCSTDKVTENYKARHFYTVIEHLCMAKALGENRDFHEEIRELEAHIPRISQIFHNMKRLHKKCLVYTKLFGFENMVHWLTVRLSKKI